MAEELITVATYRDPPMAELARSRLEAAGIECRLDDSETIKIDWLLSNVLGGVKVKVAEDRADEARLLLGELADPEGLEAEALAAPPRTRAEELYSPLDTGPEIDRAALARAGQWILLAAMAGYAVWMAAQ